MIDEMSVFLGGVATGATLRVGDYPDERGTVDLVLVLSQISRVERVRSFYARAAAFPERAREEPGRSARREDTTRDAARDLPSLL